MTPFGWVTVLLRLLKLVRAAEDDGEAEKPETSPPKTKTSVYVLHLSDRSPIGEDTKVVRCQHINACHDVEVTSAS